MSKPRSSINDYPEHLNPFYEGDQKSKFLKIGKVKRSSSFGEALRNTLLFKSIRGKKKKRQLDTPSSPPELRRNEANVATQHRQTLPTIISQSPSPSRVSAPVRPSRITMPVPLPRSRFSERVAQPNTNIHETSISKELTLNPFEKEEVPTVGKIRLKRKKQKAPLPPNSVASNISSPHNSSKWSLTSEATDISAHSDNEGLSGNVHDPSVSMSISNIVKEIEKLTKDDDTKDKSSESEIADIPDLVSSSIEVTVQYKDYCQPIDENFNLVSEICDNQVDVEDPCPDVLYNTSCRFNLNEEPVGEADKVDSHNISDSLTNLINSIELNNNDNKLEDKTDSLTNIINSINMIENECYESPQIPNDEETAILNADLEEILNSKDESKNCNDTSIVEEEQCKSKIELVSNVAVI